MESEEINEELPDVKIDVWCNNSMPDDKKSKIENAFEEFKLKVQEILNGNSEPSLQQSV